MSDVRLLERRIAALETIVRNLSRSTNTNTAQVGSGHNHDAAYAPAAHVTDTTTHGTTGDVVGTTDTQTLSNKTLTTPTIADYTNAGHDHQDADDGGQLDHGLALTGLTDDDHTQYLLLAGRSGGQTARGGTASGDDLTLESTSHATKGDVIVQPSGGNLLVGTNTVIGATVLAEIKGSGSKPVTLALHRETANALGPELDFFKRRSGMGVVSSGDNIGTIGFGAAGGSDIVAAAAIIAQVDGTPGAVDMPGRLLFLTTPDGSATLAEAVRINNSQNLIIADGKRIESDEVRARDSGGLALYDDAGSGLFVADGGNVGVGTADPQRKLHIQDTSNGPLTLLALDNVDTTNDNGAVVSFRTTTTGTGAAAFQQVASIRAQYTEHNHATRSAALAFITTNGGASAERLWIDPDGKIGIGTTTPQGRLHGHDGTGGFLFVTKTAIDGTAQTLIPNGSGDVLYRLHVDYVIRLSSGAVSSGIVEISNGGNTGFHDIGGETYNLRVNADGSADIRRTAGSTTATFAATLVWL